MHGEGYLRPEHKQGVQTERDPRRYLQISEGVEEQTQGEPGLVEKSLRLWDAGQGAPEGPDANGA